MCESWNPGSSILPSRSTTSCPRRRRARGSRRRCRRRRSGRRGRRRPRARTSGVGGPHVAAADDEIGRPLRDHRAYHRRSMATRCASCGNDVPEGTYCIWCGNPLSGGSRGFAAAPHERTAAPSPDPDDVPRTSPGGPRLRSGSRSPSASATVAVLAIAAVLPDGGAASARPWSGLMALPRRRGRPRGGASLARRDHGGERRSSAALLRVLRADGSLSSDALGEVAMKDALFRGHPHPHDRHRDRVGRPARYLAFHRFNDVLDGVSFGAVAGAALSGGAACRPQRPPVERPPARRRRRAWLADLAQMSPLLPVVFASAMAGALAALWLRPRAPTHDRRGSACSAIGVRDAARAAPRVERDARAMHLGVYPSLVLVALIAVTGSDGAASRSISASSRRRPRIRCRAKITCPN